MKNLSRLLLVVSLFVVGCAKNPDTSRAVSVPQGRLIYKAHKRTKEQARRLSPVVMIKVGEASCSASHVGDGVLLTAYHCVSAVEIAKAAKGKVPQIAVTSPSLKAAIGPLQGYELSFPELEDVLVLGTRASPEFNPIPDLAAIRLTGKQRVQLLSLPTLKIGREKLPEGESNLVIAGFGIEDFGSYAHLGPFKWYRQPKSGNLNDGSARVAEVGKFVYYLDFREDNKDESVALPGDSGGPLLKKEKDGTYAVYGVLSTYGRHLEGGFFEPISLVHSNTYTRLDREPVTDWLDEVLKVEP